MRIRKLAAIVLGATFILADPSGALELAPELVHNGFIYYYDMVVDAGGHPHAFLNDTEFDLLHYTERTSGSWSPLSFIGPASNFDENAVSGAVDSQGAAHVAYDGEAIGNSFYYKSNAGGAWAGGVVRTGARWYSMALFPGQEELPRVAYYREVLGLTYAEMNSGGGWTHFIIDNSGGPPDWAGRYPDLALDAQGNAHISYYAPISVGLRYATNASGSWQWENVLSSGSMSDRSFIAIEPDGTVVINYVEGGHVRLARLMGGNWVHRQVTDQPGRYGRSDLALDVGGNAVIAYNDSTTNGIWLAVERDGTFTNELAVHPMADGDGPVLVVDGEDVHMLTWTDITRDVIYHHGVLDPPTGAQEWQGVRDPIELSVAPNPVRGQASVRYATRRAGRVSFEIYDVSGRLVRGVGERAHSGGESSLVWEAGDLAAGVYLMLARCEERSVASRFVVLR